MSVSATEGVGAGAASAGLGSVVDTMTASSADKDMFLQLLVAQLRYQDPMNPADTSEFLSQSAQFTSLEKMQDVADRTTVLIGTQMAFGASALVGQTVKYTLADGTDGAGTVKGVRFDAEGPVLDVDGVQVPMVQILGVGTVPTAPPKPESTGTGATGTGT
ncbi:flagellar hook capping FlgD N-terminal domain-containing protein [Nocardioides sp.]|uniref:flagellar hook capping FlgD N-terminal domain-containing protein n=1 Tax=Nocardioides sp. TaxID=35761 RepID=UPI0035178132